MAVHAEHHGSDGGANAPSLPERLRFEGRDWLVYSAVKIAAVFGLVGSLLLGYMYDPSFRRFYFAYLVAYAFCLSVAVGALFFVLIQHLTRAAWSVSVRRIAEVMASTMPVLGVLAAPIIFSVLTQKGDLYRWALPYSSASPAAIKAAAAGEDEVEPTAIELDPNPQVHEHPRMLDPLTLQKRAFLNPWFFTIALAICFFTWTTIALWYRRQSVNQDRTANPALTLKMQNAAAPALVVFGVTVSIAAWLLLMSLDPHWYSTMFAVYYFSGSVLSFFASIIIIIYMLRRTGYLSQSVTIEHFHDLGKFQFAFVFFWGYIAFSQYMLLWYANIPETTGWYSRRGATTAHGHVTGWTYLSLAILFGQFLIPFAGLLSRHVKRQPALLALWAVWLLVFHYLDLYWVVMPEYGPGFKVHAMDLFAVIGVTALMLTGMFRFSATRPLRPTADPRLADSLAFQNI